MRYGFILLVVVFFISVFSIANPSKKNSQVNFTDTLETERNYYMQQVLSSIKGKEKLDADSVFKNIKFFKGIRGFSASHFLLMMNIGWGKGLGINCTYCHNQNDWASDEKPQKDIARQMYKLRKTINDELGQIKNLQSNPVLINCVTCHRGKIIPLTD